jgi:hypothetical protein
MAVETRVNGALAHALVVAIGDFIASGLDFNDPMSRCRQQSVVTPPNCAVQSAFSMGRKARRALLSIAVPVDHFTKSVSGIPLPSEQSMNAPELADNLPL